MWGPLFEMKGVCICGRFEELRRQNPVFLLPQGNYSQRLTAAMVQKTQEYPRRDSASDHLPSGEKNKTNYSCDCHLSLCLFPLNHFPYREAEEKKEEGRRKTQTKNYCLSFFQVSYPEACPRLGLCGHFPVLGILTLISPFLSLKGIG